jgi:hypothetical protein
MTTRSSTTKTVLLALGSMAVLVGVGSGIGGGALVWAHNTQRDSAGFYSTSAERVDTPTSALTSERIDFGVNEADYRWIPGDGATAVRLQASPAGDKPVFVGIARSTDVERYLAGSAHARVTDFEVDPFRPELRESGGTARPAPPTAQTFWAKSVNGAGTQTLDWPVQSGSWSVVVMNADSSPGVAVDVAIGAKTGVLLPIGIGLAGFAIVALAGGVAMIVAGSTGGPGRARQSPKDMVPSRPAQVPASVA